MVALLLVPPAALAQSGSRSDVPSRGVERAGSAAGMKRAAYIAAAQVRAGKLAGQRFDRIDTAHKGVIGRDAYIKYYRARSAQFAGKRFDRIDTDHNGVLEPSEIAAWRADHRRPPRTRPANTAAH
ncbi:MAG: hypothetical protein ACREE1_14715 [Stellaceae bacterium]